MTTTRFSTASRRIFRVLAGSLFLTACSLPRAADDAAVQRGFSVFLQNQCDSCHGTVGQGGERGAGPRIAPRPLPMEAFELQLRQPRASMPRYTVQAIDAQRLKDLYAYVDSIPDSPPVESIPLLRDAMRPR